MVGCQVGCSVLQNTVLAHWEAETYNAGCYNPNSKLDDGVTPSPHAIGEAIDIGIEVPFRGRGSTGQTIFYWFYDHRAALGIVQIIWDGQIWSSSHAGEGIRSYTVNPHHDHIHVQLNPTAARNPNLPIPPFGGAPPIPSPYPPASGQPPVLRQGSSGMPVRLAQQLLINAGAHIAVDGVFGAETSTAVRAFQASHGLTADGIIGPNTWAKLTAPTGNPAPAPGTGDLPTIRLGSVGKPVVTAQWNLNRKGAHLTADGKFGPATDKAVRVFQSNIRTYLKLQNFAVDGIVGPATWYWLLK